jgi:hypothetical protein
MTGYHVYYQIKDDTIFEPINYLVQLASILCWKKYYGTINLYCNKKYLQSISKYGLDKEYDNINTDLLEGMPFKDQQIKYWSFCKIYAALEISKQEIPFCIIDTDIIISAPNMLSNKSNVLFFHEEEFDIDNNENLYPAPENWLVNNLLNWNCNPMNCAILCFNYNFKNLIEEWYDTVFNILLANNATEFINNDVNAMFIEQRLLPVIINKLQLSAAVVLPNIYQSHLSNSVDGSEWVPKLHTSFNSIVIIDTIKHIWGTKQFYSDISVRESVVKFTKDIIDTLNTSITYQNILIEINKIK